MGAYGLALAAILVTLWITPSNTQVMTYQMKECLFPFTWKGQSYSACTAVDSFVNWEWCGVKAVVEGYFDWGYCIDGNNPDPVPPPPPACPHIKYTTTSTGVGYGSGFELTKDTPYLALTGELWDVFSKTITDILCAIPFVYNGVSYDACTSIGWSAPWCAYDANYVRGRWDECKIDPCN